MANEKVSKDEPHDELTRLANEMLDHLSSMGEVADDVHAVVMLTRGNEAGIGMLGYDTVAPATVHVLTHLKSMLATTGVTIKVIPMPKGSMN